MLLGLGVTLHPAHDDARRHELARLAVRLGYREVWLAAPAVPLVTDLAALAEAAAPAALGLAVPDLTAEAAEALHAAFPDLLLGADRPDSAVTAAAPGRVRHRFAGRVEAGAGGVVVDAETREELARLVAAAVAARTAAGLTPAACPVVAEVPVAIGRTMQEAEARAARDPRFARDRQVRDRGLFGTYEHGQEQVLALARAGADLLLVTLADELDVADLLAQVRALVVGATPVLHARTS